MTALDHSGPWPRTWSDSLLPFVALAHASTGGRGTTDVVRAIVASNVGAGHGGRALAVLQVLEADGLLIASARSSIEITPAGRARLATWRSRWPTFVALVDGAVR